MEINTSISTALAATAADALHMALEYSELLCSEISSPGLSKVEGMALICTSPRVFSALRQAKC